MQIAPKERRPWAVVVGWAVPQPCNKRLGRTHQDREPLGPPRRGLCAFRRVVRDDDWSAPSTAPRRATDRPERHHGRWLGGEDAELRCPGRVVNRKRVARLMRERGIQGAHRRRRRSLTRPDSMARPAPDLARLTPLEIRGNVT
ncbi:IS3 family transposase [Streptomyces avermitilis]